MKNRRDIRDRLRNAVERSKAGPPAPVPVVFEIACICGQLLRLSVVDDEQRCACPGCKRKFLMTFTDDAASGRRIPCPVYLDDTMTTGETMIAESPGGRPAPPAARGGMDDAFGPPPPAALVCICPGCSRKMRVKKEFYDRRARCPDCKARILLTLIYDPGARQHSIQPLRVTDAPSGETWHIDG